MTTPRHETEPGAVGSHHGSVHSPGHDGRGRHGGHGLTMMLMCVPMLLIAGFLMVTGAAGSGTLVVALLCVTMMAVMMFVMPGGHNRR